MGGARHNAYVFWDEQGLKKARALGAYEQQFEALGGPGSGHFGHAGRKGVGVGGSLPGNVSHPNYQSGMRLPPTVYRGGVSQDQSVDFKGLVYVSTDRQSAAQWGDVHEYQLKTEQKLVDVGDWNAPGAKELVAHVSGLDLKSMSKLDFEDEAVQVFVQGYPEVAQWLQKHGYTGMRLGRDAALVGELSQHAMRTAGGPGSGHFGHAGRKGVGVGGSLPGGDRKAFVEAAIRRGEAHKVTEDEFLEYHLTGHIEPHAYERYEAGDLDFIHKNEFDTLLETREVNGKSVEIRLQSEPAKYGKRTVAASDAERERLYAEYEKAAAALGTTPMMAGIDLGHGSDKYNSLAEFEKRWRDSGSDWVRDERGEIVYYSPQEMQERGLPAFSYTVGAFVGDKAVGYAGDEFGASGVYVARAYQRHGLGLSLLKTYLEKSGRLAKGSQLGQMTPAGRVLVRKLHQQLVKDAALRGAGGPGSGHFGHAGRKGIGIGGSLPGKGSTSGTVKIYHNSPDLFAEGKPSFDAFFGDEAFVKAFPNEWGEHTYEIELPKSQVLDLDSGSDEAIEFMTIVATFAYPNDPDNAAWIERLKARDPEAVQEFYEAWTDKSHTLNALTRMPKKYGAVKFGNEYVVTKETLAKVAGKKLKTAEVWRELGGPGSGHFGHAGRKGIGKGGSLPGKGVSDSVVVGPATRLGQILSGTWYHGTRSSFDLSQIREPLFLTSNPKIADAFSTELGRQGSGDKVFPIHVTVKNPLDVSTHKDKEKLRDILIKAGIEVTLGPEKEGDEWSVPALESIGHDGAPIDVVYLPKAREAIRNAGYDALYTSDDYFEFMNTYETLVPLSPSTQVRSVFAAARARALGGAGSGHFGHAGRKGVGVGGSLPGGVNSPAFKRWFGDSTVVNADGTPKVMYHATTSDITEFKAFTHFGTSQAALDRDKTLTDFFDETLKRHDRSVGANVVPVYLRVENPLRMPDLASIDSLTGEPLPENWDDAGPDDEIAYPRGWESDEAVGTTLLEMGIIDIDEFEDKGRDNAGAFELLKEKGYDGIVYSNIIEDPGNDSYIVFDPTQVKSAIGNTGAFSSTSKLITGGGPGSGHFGHAGRKGMGPGGSLPGKGSASQDARSFSTLTDDLDSAESVEDVQAALDHYHATPLNVAGKTFPKVYVTDTHIVEWDGEDAYPNVTDKTEWVNTAPVKNYFPDYEDRLNDEFWESGGEVYHATTEENAVEIEASGIEARNITRGLSNRSEGAAVFTTTNLEETAYGSYGDVVFAIDIAAMAKDGYKPYTSQEPDIVEGELRGGLASAVGLTDYEYDYESGMSPYTVAIHGAIPAKYIKRVGGSRRLGGHGSGHFGHAGRKGIGKGGSLPGKGSSGTGWTVVPPAGHGATPEQDRMILEKTVGLGKVDGKEHVVLANGSVHTVDGDEYNVSVPIELVDGSQGAFTLFHNHPGLATSLSQPDLRVLGYGGITRIVAISHDGDRFEASRGGNWHSSAPYFIGTEVREKVSGIEEGPHFDDPSWRHKVMLVQHAENLVLNELKVIKYRYSLVSEEAKSVDQEAHRIAQEVMQKHPPMLISH
jgi:GNAT superfamily N-acetyltransferase